jgi:Ca-activated chloride channel family protein
LGAARKAKEQGARIFTIGLGTTDGSTVPGESAVEGFKKDQKGQAVISKLDEGLLKQIAKETGGAYHRSTRGELEVDRIVDEVRQMSQKGLKTEKTIEYEENFQYFLIPAFILLLLEMYLSERKKS